MTVLDALVANGWPRETLTLDVWRALPEDSDVRMECVEGVVVFMASPTRPHARAQSEISFLLRTALGRRLDVYTEFELLVAAEPLTVRRPDVIVSDPRGQTDERALPAEVHLVVEVISPSSGRTDRVMKLAEYAEAGIPAYWLIDLEAGEIICFELADDAYEVHARGSSVQVEVCGAPVAVDVADLAV
jgi:Uma2 family endonuclease